MLNFNLIERALNIYEIKWNSTLITFDYIEQNLRVKTESSCKLTV